MSEHTPAPEQQNYNFTEREAVGLDETGYRGTARDEVAVDETGYRGTTRGVVHTEHPYVRPEDQDKA